MNLLNSCQEHLRLIFLSSCLFVFLSACVRPVPITPFPTVVQIATQTPTLVTGNVQPGVETDVPPIPTADNGNGGGTTPYPAPTQTATPAIPPSPPPLSGYPLYLPLVSQAEPTPLPNIEAALPPTVAPQPTVALPPTIVPTPPPPPLNFAQIQEQVEAEGQVLAFAKMGFHVGIGGNTTGLGEWMRSLDEAGVPFFLKSADNAGPLFEAQTLAQASGVEHTLVYRRSGDLYDTPNYDLSPQLAAEQHWQLHRNAFPPELDPSLVWIETINEVDKERSEWMAQFAIYTAELAWADGFKWAAFGWSAGEPEPLDWEGEQMLAFLRLAGDNRHRLAVALHEYSYVNGNIADGYPFKVGRFQFLFDVVDGYNIPRPTVLITEWGWQYDSIPPAGQAMVDVAWAAEMYANYPQVKGAAIWYLGIGYSDIADKTQQLIAPMRYFSLGTYYAIPRFGVFIDPAQHQP